jgi:tripeptide aminopeptidase
MFENYSYTFLDRFLKYVQIDTQSDPYSSTNPSTMKQKDLGNVLVLELKAMGVECDLDEYGYVYATIPSNTSKEVPVICFCSHMDTSPDSSGTGVKPIVHRNYQGEDLILPDDASQIIRQSDHPDLTKQIGNDIITASGTTLLGADNKAGVAEIMDAVHFLVHHPEVKHGTIKILFTPDEEIGRGVDHVNLKKLGADFGYTVDGETCGSIEDETFSADAATITIKGVSAHPGFAKGKMENAIKIASEIVSILPKDKMSPESTSGREGFIHPVGIKGNVEEATVELIIREFEDEELKKYERILEVIAEEVFEKYPGSSYDIKITCQYRNMKNILGRYPQVAEFGKKAIERSGVSPKLQSIRGGTDGSRLSYLGLPCPNLFAGEHAFHSKQEWVSVQDMQKAVQTIVNLAVIWEEEST